MFAFFNFPDYASCNSYDEMRQTNIAFNLLLSWITLDGNKGNACNNPCINQEVE
jgi:hypothetical protein